jgi:hypothetical protein
LNTSLCSGQGVDPKSVPETKANSTSKDSVTDNDPKKKFPAPSNTSSVGNFDSSTIKDELLIIKESTQDIKNSIQQEIKSSIQGLEKTTLIVSITNLALFFLLIGFVYALIRQSDINAQQILSDLSIIKSARNKNSEPSQFSDGISQSEHKEKIKAKDNEIANLQKKFDYSDKDLAKMREAVRTMQDQVRTLEADIKSFKESSISFKAKSEDLAKNLTVKISELESLRSELVMFKSALIPLSTMNPVSSLGDDLIGSLSEDSTHAVSLLGCLGIVKVAGKIDMSEEVLLTTVRQFSESLTAFRSQQGRPAEAVHQELVEWANAFNKQFDGKLEIRVPTPGFSVDSKTMISSSGALKVSAVFSWSVYNSKGSIFSPAKVA